MTNKTQVDELEPSMVDNIPYHKIEEQDMWRISMVKELMDIKQGDRLAPEGWSLEDLENIMDFVCTQ